MGLTFNILIVICASFIEALFGYPARLLERIGHPVTWMGAAIDRLDARLNRPGLPATRRRRNGALAMLILLIATWVIASIIQRAALGLLPGLLALFVIGIVASSLIAQRSLYDHVAAVAEALERDDVEGARLAVARIVGRDVTSLDASAVARGAIESLAENFSDGVVAPCFFGVVAGLPGMACYKAVNTADSMIGHRTERHEAFGFFAAKLDDLLNLLPARLSSLLFAGAALVLPDASPRASLRASFRDARRHRSPNAGWPEAACAGALGLRLSGPRVYHGVLTDEPWIGEGRSEIGAAEIRRALSLYRIACALQAVFLGLVAVLIARG